MDPATIAMLALQVASSVNQLSRPRRSLPGQYRDPRLENMIDQENQLLRPNAIAGPLLRRSNLKLGQRERDYLNRVQRAAGGDTLATVEGISAVNRNTAQTAADNALQAGITETDVQSGVRSRLESLYGQRESETNRRRALQADIDFENRSRGPNAVDDALQAGSTILSERERGRNLDKILASLEGTPPGAAPPLQAYPMADGQDFVPSSADPSLADLDPEQLAALQRYLAARMSGRGLTRQPW